MSDVVLTAPREKALTGVHRQAGMRRPALLATLGAVLLATLGAVILVALLGARLATLRSPY